MGNESMPTRSDVLYPATTGSRLDSQEQRIAVRAGERVVTE
jgi:hypothetical protein